MRLVADFCIIPLGVGTSLTKHVAQVQRILAAASSSGKINHLMHACGTNVEGEWTDVMDTIRLSHATLHASPHSAPRVHTTVRLDTRSDKRASIEGKVESVRRELVRLGGGGDEAAKALQRGREEGRPVVRGGGNGGGGEAVSGKETGAGPLTATHEKMKVVADFCIFPLGLGNSLTKYIAQVQLVLSQAAAAGRIRYLMHSCGTNIEGDWEDVMSVIRESHRTLHDRPNDAPRVHSTVRIGTRTDKESSIRDKTESVEREIERLKRKKEEEEQEQCRVTDVDDDHLGARVHLGILYFRKGDVSVASHYLERACKSSKARGGGGGKSGQGSWYGGLTARWGWDAWRWLGRCHAERGRPDVAMEAMGYAVKAQKASFPRGLECLKRMVNSDL
ncbi:hypothetical protein HKX48_009365 [Thoreauomyces humboldtii]|nr:hypothetical protein HKX48_009365 [Thoreauomyces humboldtii]